VLTATCRPVDAPRFALLAITASLGIFGVLRLNWTELHLLLPATRIQSTVAVWLFGAPTSPVAATLACSGADALALCAGAILAYPVAWRLRLAGTAVGAAMILMLNTGRIGTLGLAAADTSWFNALHLYGWPALLTLSIAGYVLLWMHHADRSPRRRWEAALPVDASHSHFAPSRRLILLIVGFTVLFAAASPFYLESAWVLSVAGVMASAAAVILRALNVDAHAAANLLSTPGGAYLVTQECISTPLIPIYLAAIGAYASRWRHVVIGALAVVPLFVALGILRLLVVGLPGVVSPVFFVHAFYQLLLGALVVLAAAWWRHGRPGAAGYSLAGIVGGALAAYMAAPAYALLVIDHGVAIADPQGALALLPTFQIGLYAALSIAAARASDLKRLAGGFIVLLAGQALGAPALQYLGDEWGVTVHVRDVRAWAVAWPALIFVTVLNFPRVLHAFRRSRVAAPEYHAFWDGVGAHFPDLAGAESTRYYAANEQRLFNEYLPPLAGLRILKTDLWDEAKNTRILAWASRHGAHTYGVDISEPIMRGARTAFGDGAAALHGAIGDVRALPFAAESFDAIYSMGTIEHFDETQHAIDDMARVLKCGGRAIIGVPNRHDPFLRPLFATLLQAVGWYGYGYEKSYSRRTLRLMLERAGFEVVAETAILFIPGWLRMLDLACHAWCRPLTAVTGALVRPFVWLDRHVPAVRRHGYLLATVVTKPAQPRTRTIER
jgi:exosortase/archaeosortase family protein